MLVNKRPPITLNLKVKPSNTSDIPKYIGFLEYLNIPLTTREDAFSIDIGLTVVFCFLNESTADTKINIPIMNEITLNELSTKELNSGKYGLDKYIHIPKNKVTIGGGILLFIFILFSLIGIHHVKC